MNQKGHKLHMGKWLILAGLIAAVIFLWKSAQFSGTGSSVTYLTAKTDRGDVRRTVSATGKLNPVVTVLVGSQVTGKIEKILADFNSQVKEGEIIAQIDPALFEAQRSMAKAKLDGAKAEVDRAERDLKRQEELLKKKMISQSEADKFKFLYLKAIADRDKAQAEVELAQSNLNYTIIRSPVDGIVISRDVDVGQTVAASLQAPTLFTIAKDLKEMQINVSIDEADVGQIQTGQQTYFTVDTYPGEYFAGKVTQIRNAPIIIQNVVHYDVIVYVNNKELKLKPGMTAHAFIVTAAKTDVVRVPNAALRFLPEGVEPEISKPVKPFQPGLAKSPKPEVTVWQLRSGKPYSKKIQTGMKDEFYTEVTGGLKEGDEVTVGQTIHEKKRFMRVNPLAKPRYKYGK